MVLCSPLLPLHKSGLHQFGGICNYLKFSNGHRFRIREKGPIFWVIDHCRNKPVVRKFVFELRSSSTLSGAAPALSKWSTELGTGRKSLVRDQRLTTISLGTVMNPQTALCDASTSSGDVLMAVKQQMDFQVMNSAENTDEASEMGSSSPLNTVNFASLEISSGELKKVLSGNGVAKSSSAGEDVMTAMKARVRTTSSRRVAVIGAGAAGLVAARELGRDGHEVVIYEQGEEVGGVWQYDPRVEDDPLGIDPNRSRVHSSMYHSLRTNLPREIMGYLDYPFLPKEEEGRDSRRFPSHREVAMYLEDFAEDYNLRGLVKFGITVDYVGQQDTRWIVKFHKTCDFRKNVHPHEKDRQDGGRQTEVFDAVVVCNGHYAEPRLVSIPGVESWPGVQIHSHNYRFPQPFQDKVVVVIGNGNSAQDITSEIATLAKEVHQCARAWTAADSSIEGQGPQHNIWRHPMVRRACFNGTVEFQDGKSALADIILYSTGYLFSFPFLDTKGYISVDDNRVDPLYKHVFPPALAPALSFIGLPWKVVPFQLMELQSRWIARLLSGKSSLPSESEMLSDIRTLYEQLEANMEFPKSYTHLVHPYQFEYIDWLAEQSGHEPVDTWRKEICMSGVRNKSAHPNTYRDEIEDQHWYDVAMTSLAQMKATSKGVSQPSAEQNSYAL